MRYGSSRQSCSDETILIEFRWELSLLRFELAMERFGRAIKAYNPNQPRVPAGAPGGGQWIDGGFHLLGPRYDPGRMEEGEHVRVAGEGDDPKPPLQRIHPDTTYEASRSARHSLEYWRQQPSSRVSRAAPSTGKTKKKS